MCMMCNIYGRNIHEHEDTGNKKSYKEQLIEQKADLEVKLERINRLLEMMNNSTEVEEFVRLAVDYRD